MSNTRSPHGDRKLRAPKARRRPPDLRRLSRALIEMALEQARLEAEARAEHQAEEQQQGDKADAV